jgi:hypothetical protein
MDTGSFPANSSSAATSSSTTSAGVRVRASVAPTDVAAVRITPTAASVSNARTEAKW